MIAGVVRGGPSARAGLKGGDRQVRVGNSLIPVGGDVIVEMDGKTVASSEDLVRMIKEHRPGEKVDFRILRNGKFLRIPVTLGEKPVQR
jgi:S1-C subfamily serine protease